MTEVGRGRGGMEEEAAGRVHVRQGKIGLLGKVSMQV